MPVEILVADDDRVTVAFLRGLLESLGHTVLTAARDTVAAQLGRWNIPVTSQFVRREQSHDVLPL